MHAELEMEVPVEHGLLIENLLDLAHAPFTHTSTFARGWPVSGGMWEWVGQFKGFEKEQSLLQFFSAACIHT